MIQLRTWYLDEHDHAVSYGHEESDSETEAWLDRLAQTVTRGGLIIVNQGGAFSFAFPASRLLRIERLPRP